MYEILMLFSKVDIKYNAMEIFIIIFLYYLL